MTKDGKLEASRDILLAAALALPRRSWLEVELVDARAAGARGYYLPDEDERLRVVYARFLSIRQELKQVLADVRPGISYKEGEEQLKVFLVAFLSATVLLRAGKYLLDVAAESRVIRAKLDEAESRYGIPRKTFTGIYKGISDPRSLWSYHEAWRFYERHKNEIYRLESQPEWKPLIELLKEEEPHFITQPGALFRRRMGYRLFSFVRIHHSGFRKAMFQLFQIGGSLVGDMVRPGIKRPGTPKKILAEHYHEIISLAEPGDVFITRHDDALSNLFLPGFWPHAALYMGTRAQRRDSELPEFTEYPEDEESFIEAKKDGVKWRSASETLGVDTVLILRPKFEKKELSAALECAASHIGKLYDFMFDFRQADRLACTAVVYRGYQGTAGKSFKLEDHAGRLALSAENLIDQLVGDFEFEVVAVCGVNAGGCVKGKAALEILRGSYKSGI